MTAMTLGILIAVTFVATAISGAIGMGGGILLLAVMASLLDPMIVVPVHGVIQMISNTTRTLRLMNRVVWSIVGLYVPGLVVGAFIGIRFYAGAGAAWFQPVIGVFVLASLVWERFMPRRLSLPRWVFVPAGLAGGVLTVLVGATGPYLAAFFLRDDLDRHQVVATKSAIQMLGHLVKIPAFASIGFVYRDQLHLMLPLTACAIAGTFAGAAVLDRLNERWFRLVFRGILGALAVRLIAQAIW